LSSDQRPVRATPNPERERRNGIALASLTLPETAAKKTDESSGDESKSEDVNEFAERSQRQSSAALTGYR